jgi:hypothetical protein
MNASLFLLVPLLLGAVFSVWYTGFSLVKKDFKSTGAKVIIFGTNTLVTVIAFFTLLAMWGAL